MTIDVTIEKMIYGGDGLARMGATAARPGKSVFIPFVLEGEKLRARVTEEKPGFIRARAQEILAASSARIEPKCPYFLRCGGCHYQHAGYQHQLRMKEAILRETLRRGAKLDWAGEVTLHASPPWNYRNRTRLKVRANPFAIGYYKFNSHELLPVQECPISSPLINRAISALWQLGRAGVVPQQLSEIEFFVNAEDSGLVVECYCPSLPEDAEDFWSALRGQMAQARGMAMFAPSISVPKNEHSEVPLRVFGESALEYRTGRGNYSVSAGSFFQVNRFMIGELLRAALPGEGGARALDLYAGGGLFSAQLAQTFDQVTAVEPAASSSRDLAANCPKNVALRRMPTEMFLAEHFAPGHFDFVLADPPRAGLGERVASQLVQLAAPRITYVSCDPATLARDATVLMRAGYAVRELHFVDLFPQTYHLETVMHFAR